MRSDALASFHETRGNESVTDTPCRRRLDCALHRVIDIQWRCPMAEPLAGKRVAALVAKGFE